MYVGFSPMGEASTRLGIPRVSKLFGDVGQCVAK